MRRTRPLTLVLLAIFGGFVGFVVEIALASTGRPIIALPLSLSITLVAAGAIVLALALPIGRAIRGTNQRPIDPFRAMRVVVLAKASSMVGSLIAGVGFGVVVYLLSRAVVPAVASLWLSIGAAIAGVVFLVCGLVAEKLCTLPPDDRDPDHPEAVPDRRLG
ncbi:DUF3180 domain-containing protein [Subtercola boreus]|uniref:DUF3180 domain-containing protein n=1 Tax=Subtercola boreus TaxID=120213 RepID=A0A3E0W6Y2_9MICO|nr:DUF3180 domain-containing protein [Subtercola boreus]RFA18570.1 hypothetical protein B7R23_14505 [Subtercola boreus]RFA18686.1 hypothetical protein B7R24_14465 [Subtercola boreus]RFA25289.1 hypothetical protein B7R25_14500 [Subtercola boreus]